MKYVATRNDSFSQAAVNQNVGSENECQNFALYLSVPLGVYRWLTEGPGALFDSIRRWIQARRGSKATSEAREHNPGPAEESISHDYPALALSRLKPLSRAGEGGRAQ